MKTINPVTGDLITDYDETTPAELEQVLDRSVSAYRGWRSTPIEERAAFLESLGDVLTEMVEEIAGLISTEMGKPITEARAEVHKSAACCYHYATHGPEQIADDVVDFPEAEDVRVRYRPIGPVLALMPWNYPLWQVIRCAAPILLAGNTMVLKHATNVSGSALLIAQAIDRAKGPADLLQVVLVPGRQASALIEDDRVAGVTLTGSEQVGVQVAQACAPRLKPSVLELGGSDPFLVLGSADVEAAAQTAVRARFQNTGQSCIAAKRFIVVEEHVEEFTRLLVEGAAQLVVGDPHSDDTQIGPMARRDLRDELHEQVRSTVDAGATLELGGTVESPETAYYPPTVVSGVQPGMVMFDEETFGPAAAIITARDTEDAVDLANRSRYGLSSAVWTEDEEELSVVREHLDVGGIFVNGMTASDPRIPFGGVKMSGWGRELGEFGLKEFTNVQTYRRN
ncbi:NAD-dependent succinate-semialdehyde dehydrogenase [Demetria terragena]|uniref:NAD-dependent succinate-semialdehyde dehydrogenase n=1 Tax=Demetria terragena TaxID=63959 RepID=UPI0003815CA9|nr:NAD-dependent succinate-semialdehyde dehydrogenase [Demetria terragena]